MWLPQSLTARMWLATLRYLVWPVAWWAQPRSCRNMGLSEGVVSKLSEARQTYQKLSVVLVYAASAIQSARFRMLCRTRLSPESQYSRMRPSASSVLMKGEPQPEAVDSLGSNQVLFRS